MSPVLQLRVPEEALGKLKTLSQETGISVSELVRACITRAFPYVEEKARAATKAGDRD